MSYLNSEIITGIALIFLSILFIYAGLVNVEWARIFIVDYDIMAIGGGFVALGLWTLRNDRERMLINTNASNIDGVKDATMSLRKRTFGWGFGPFVFLIVLTLGQWLYFSSLSHDISTNFSNHIPDVKSTVLKYQNEFTPTEVNSIRDGHISAQIATKAAGILSNISSQFLTSSVLCIVIGLGWTLFRVKISKGKGDKATKEVTKRWVDSGSNGSSAVTAAVSVGLTIVGAVSLLSPEIVGGYILAGLEILLMCVIVGILAQYNSGGIESTAKPTSNNDNNVLLYSDKTMLWDTLISIQFVMLVLGIALIIGQVFSFIR
jgi:hypothetical protein